MTQIAENYYHLATGFRNIIITLAHGIIASIRGMTISLIIRMFLMMIIMIMTIIRKMKMMMMMTMIIMIAIMI
jgi:hypothetical protein